MLDEKSLLEKLATIDKKGYSAYQTLLGHYSFSYFNLIIDKVPRDPYAPIQSGIFRIQVNPRHPKMINLFIDSRIKEIAFRDFIARSFYQSIQQLNPQKRGTGHSGMISICQPGQLILERNSVIAKPDMIEIRIYLGLPAFGRKINATGAKEMLCDELPAIVSQSLFQDNINFNSLQKHIETAEDADFLRKQLEQKNLVAFIADKAILPRESGTSHSPLKKSKAIPFQSPKKMRVQFKCPHAGWVSGLAIPKGVTLITGGGYHGKSTLLNTIESAIYNHIPAA